MSKPSLSSARLGAPLVRLGAGMALLASLGGCALLFPLRNDPLTREGVWRPTHANRSNLVASVDKPADLVSGHGPLNPEPTMASVAVERLRAGKVKNLPQVGLAQIQLGSQPESSGQGQGNN